MESVNLFEGTLLILLLLFARFGIPITIMWTTNMLYGRYNEWRLSHQM